MNAVVDRTPTTKVVPATAKAAPAPAAPVTPVVDVASLVAENNKLRKAVESLDEWSQMGCGKISVLARLALDWIDKNHLHGNFDTIETVLNMIWYQSDDMSNTINVEAEEVGCNFRDPDQERRSIARDEARVKGRI